VITNDPTQRLSEQTLHTFYKGLQLDKRSYKNIITPKNSKRLMATLSRGMQQLNQRQLDTP